MADAVGFVSSGVFAANMTGNTVLVGLALAGQDWLLAGERALTLVTFFAGAMLGRRLGLLARPWMPLLLEALLVGVAALPWPGVMAPVWIIALAMGVQASAFTAFRGVAVSTIVITSSIAHLAEDTQDSLHGRRHRLRAGCWRRSGSPMARAPSWPASCCRRCASRWPFPSGSFSC